MRFFNQNKLTQQASPGICKFMVTGVFILFSFTAFSQVTRYENEKYVIVLDVQQYWTDKTLSKEVSAQMLNSINALIEKSNPEKVIYIKSIHKVLLLSFKGFKVDTTLNNEFDRNLKIVNDNIFIKTEGDAFATKELTDFLKKNHAKEIMITGLLAEKCVNATTLGGLSRGYSIFLVSSAIGGKSHKSMEKVFKKLEVKGAKILTMND